MQNLRTSLNGSRLINLNRNNSELGDQLRAFKENYQELRASHARLSRAPERSRIKILKFYQRAMLPLTRDLQRRTSSRNFDFALLGQALLTSPETRDAFLADDEYHHSKSVKQGGPPPLTEQAKNSLYSEKVDYFRDFKNKEQRLLLIRGAFLYFYEPKQLKRVTRIPLSHIHKIELIRKCAELLLLSIEGYHPYLIQTLHRLELTVFLVDQCKRLNLPLLMPAFKERLHITSKGHLVDALSPLESSVINNLPPLLKPKKQEASGS